MDNLEIYEVEQGSEAWHDLRCGRITASKFKDMMSKITTAGYVGLINTTAGEIVSGEIEPTYSNAIMERGIDLEPDARKVYEEMTGVEVTEVGFVTNEEVFAEYIGVSPDGIITKDNGLLEIKCPLMKTHVEYLLKGLLPNVYKWQVQGQLLVTGADYCDFMSYYPGMKPLILRVLPDEEMHQQLQIKMKASVDEIKRIVNIIN